MRALKKAPTEGWALIHHPDDPAAVPADGRAAGEGHWWVRVEHVRVLTTSHGFVNGLREEFEIDPGPVPKTR